MPTYVNSDFVLAASLIQSVEATSYKHSSELTLVQNQHKLVPTKMIGTYKFGTNIPINSVQRSMIRIIALLV